MVVVEFLCWKFVPVSGCAVVERKSEGVATGVFARVWRERNQGVCVCAAVALLHCP